MPPPGVRPITVDPRPRPSEVYLGGMTTVHGTWYRQLPRTTVPADEAQDALDRVLGLTMARPSSAYAAIGVVLGYLGALRIHAASTGDPEAVTDRRLLAALADMESVSERLVRTPVRGATGALRRELWAEVHAHAARVRTLLSIDSQRRDVSGTVRSPSQPRR